MNGSPILELLMRSSCLRWFLALAAATSACDSPGSSEGDDTASGESGEEEETGSPRTRAFCNAFVDLEACAEQAGCTWVELTVVTGDAATCETAERRFSCEAEVPAEDGSTGCQRLPNGCTDAMVFLRAGETTWVADRCGTSALVDFARCSAASNDEAACHCGCDEGP